MSDVVGAVVLDFEKKKCEIKLIGSRREDKTNARIA